MASHGTNASTAQRLVAFGHGRGNLVGLEHDVVALPDLVALDLLVASTGLPVSLSTNSPAHAMTGSAVEGVESDPFGGRGSRVEGHRTGQLARPSRSPSSLRVAPPVTLRTAAWSITRPERNLLPSRAQQPGRRFCSLPGQPRATNSPAATRCFPRACRADTTSVVLPLRRCVPYMIGWLRNDLGARDGGPPCHPSMKVSPPRRHG